MTTKYKGIYGYQDKKTGEIIYIGKDSNLYKKSRHRQHHSKKRYSHQQINRILQSNAERYTYIEIIQLPQKTTRNELGLYEMRYIQLYDPKFNFTIGGDGGATNTGKKFSKEHCLKISNALKGNVLSEETKRKISENNARHTLGKHLSEETKRKISESEKGKEVSFETRMKQSFKQNKSGYYRVFKRYEKGLKQGFRWEYKWRENGKMKSLSSVNLLALKEKVESKGLLWLKLSDVQKD